MQTLANLVLLFTIYSFIGWCCETTLCSVVAHKFINRGFLNGPFCPIYGFGGLLIIFLLTPLARLSPFPESVIVLFFSGVICTSVLEYFTAYLLEKLFHAKWWDYSDKKFNIHGRVCLENALLFGLMSVLLMGFIHPVVRQFLSGLPSWLSLTSAAVLLLYFFSDCYASVCTVLKLNDRLTQLQEVLDEIREKSDVSMSERQSDFQQKFGELKDLAGERLKQLEEVKSRLELGSRAAQRRIMEAFPHMSSTLHPESLARLKEALNRKLPKKDK